MILEYLKILIFFYVKVWPIENEISNLNKVEHSTKLNFLICLYKDVEKFANILPFLFEIARSKFKQENPRILTLLKGYNKKNVNIIFLFKFSISLPICFFRRFSR